MTPQLPSPEGVPDAWRRSPVPVIVGFAPPDTIRFDQLADPRVIRRLLDQAADAAAPDESSLRAAALTLVHRCLLVVELVLTAPLVLDGLAMEVRATDLGLRLRGGEPTAIWIAGLHAVAPTDPATHLGAMAFGLLVPIVAAIREVQRLPSRGVDNLMLDSLAAGYRRCARLGGLEPDPGFVQRLVAGAGRPDHAVARPLRVCLDGGPPVTFHVPRSCCVLASTATEGSCPTCPLWPDDATRRDAIRAWAGGMDDDDFRATTGRARMGPTDRWAGPAPQAGAAG